MSEFCVNPEFKGEKAIYDLYGVSNHYGGMGGGHYTAYVRNLTSGKWFNHDDSRVSPANVSEIKSDAAYVLFYVRRSQAPWYKPGASDAVEAPAKRRTDGITIGADRGGNSTTLYHSVASSSSSSQGAGVGRDVEEGRTSMDTDGDDIVSKSTNPSLLD